MEQFIRALNGDKITLDNVLPDDLNFKDLDWIIIILRNLSDQALEATGRIVQMMIEELDERMGKHSNGTQDYARVLRRLQALCRYAKRLPRAWYTSGLLAFPESTPRHQSALSDVWLGRLGQIDVAVKVIRVRLDTVTKVEKVEFTLKPALCGHANIESMQAYYTEVAAWMWMRHRNVAALLGIADLVNLSLVSLWMANGTILDYLKQYPNAYRKNFIKEMTEGLRYIHTLGLIHGDLKAANVLIDEEHVACLTDFGLVKARQSSVAFTATDTVQGTIRWMSPELLALGESEVQEFTVASDCYSLAMTTWEIYAGKVPFDYLSRDHLILSAILKGDRPPRPVSAAERGSRLLSDTEWACIEACWLEDPSQRPSLEKFFSSFADAVIHPVWQMQEGLPTLAIAFHPYGHQLSLSLENSSIKVYNIRAGRDIQTLNGHADWAQCIMYAPDGNTLASGSADKTVKLWDPVSGQCICTYSGHTTRILSIQWSPDGQCLASTAEDSTIRLWPLRSGQTVLILSGHSDWVRSVTFSYDGALVASASDDTSIRLWDAQTGRTLCTLTGHKQEVLSLAFSCHTGSLVSASRDGAVIAWDIDADAVLYKLERQQEAVRRVAHSPDRAQIALALISGNVSIHSVTAGELLDTIPHSLSEIWALSYSSDGRFIAVGGEEGCEVYEINVRIGSEDLCAPELK